MAEQRPTFQEALVGLLKRIYTAMASKEDVDALKNEMASLSSSVEHLSEDLQRISLSLERLVPELQETLEKIASPQQREEDDFPSLASAGLTGEEGVNTVGLAGLGAGVADEALQDVLAKLDEIYLILQRSPQEAGIDPGNLAKHMDATLKQAFDPVIQRLQGVVRRGKALENAAADLADIRSATRSMSRLFWILWILTLLNFLGIAGLLLDRLGLIKLILP